MRSEISKFCSMIVLIALLLAFFSSCNYDQIKSKSTTGELTIEADESIYPVVQKEVDEFTRLNTEAKIKIVTKPTKEVIADLVNGNTKMIIAGRDFDKQESDVAAANKTEMKKNEFALDGIGVIVNPSNPIVKLNYNELKRIFTGETTEWANLDGDNKDQYKGKIKLFITRGNSSLHDIFRQNILGSADYSKNSTICSTSTQMVNFVESDKMAIGFTSMSWITKFADTLDTGVKALKIATVDSAGRISDYVAFMQAYIANRTYPMDTKAYIFSTDYSMDLSVGFLSFLVAYDGQKIVLNSGLVPVTQPVKLIQLN